MDKQLDRSEELLRMVGIHYGIIPVPEERAEDVAVALPSS